MALTKISRGLLSTGVSDSSDATAITIDSSENVGIGTTSPTEKLQVKGAIGFEASNSTNRWSTYTYTDNTFRLNYNGAGADEVTIDSSGNVDIADGDLSFASGHGINFSATGDGSGSMSSELLDDYEEGTWTPVAAGVAVTNFYSATYTKIGRQVIAECYINLNTQNNSNQFQISGLPYAAASGIGYGGGTIGYVGSADWGGFGAPIIPPSNTYAYFHYIDGTHGNSITNAELYTLSSGNLLFLGQFIYSST